MRQAAEILRRGGLVAFPTETVYGLGARAEDDAAVRRIYRVKGRPSDNPLIVHVDGPQALARITRRPTALARRLIAAFWPGPLTLVMERAPGTLRAASGGLKTIAVRCPAHPVALQLIRALGEPIAAPSANISGRPSPTTAAHVDRDLHGRIPLILDGGSCQRGLESAIVDVRGSRPKLLRHGVLTPAEITRAAGMPLALPGPDSPSVPGARHRHYAPSCRVTLVSTSDIRRGGLAKLSALGSGLLHRTSFGGPTPAFRRRVSGGVDAYARSLFAALRDAEKAGIRVLFVETVSDRGIGRAVMDRLRRAAAP